MAAWFPWDSLKKIVLKDRNDRFLDISAENYVYAGSQSRFCLDQIPPTVNFCKAKTLEVIYLF
jgi:hypothetical protein